MSDYKSFLSPEGEEIYGELLKHCQTNLKIFDVDEYELSMLANSFHLYAECARVCNTEGVSMVFQTKNGVPDDEDEDLAADEKRAKGESKGKGGMYQQIRPEYTVMKNEYANILKHSAKFGLNPGDRAKIFKGLSQKEKGKKKFETK